VKSSLVSSGHWHTAKKQGGADAAWAACEFILPGVLAVLGFALLHSRVAEAQIIDTNEQSFYDNARPMMDYSLSDIMRAAPELQGLESTDNSDELASILYKAGKVTEDLLDKMPNLTSREDVIQAKLRDSLLSKGQRRRSYNYLILVHRNGTHDVLEEYRTQPDGTEMEVQDLDADYTVTSGFASSWLHFLPSNRMSARFRYLGQQTDAGRRCYVVAFAQKPGWVTVLGKVTYKGISVSILYQGIAWIDEENYRIIRLRTDLLAPRPSIGLEKQTTELHFGEIRLSKIPSPLWLPQEVVVTTDWKNQTYRNIHRYSDYRLFEVETNSVSAPPDQPLPTKP
jgi:hypothetical protein